MPPRANLRAIALHAALILGAAALAVPIWLAFVAATRASADFVAGDVGWLPGPHGFANFWTVLAAGDSADGLPPAWPMLLTTLVVALLIALGKIAVSLPAAFAVTYFRFPFRSLAFWTIFLTLMLPVEVRIVPTFQVVADLGLLNSWAGLSLPLIASATATFLFRQTFMSVPDELTEAARIDAAGPLRFFFDVLLPLSRTNVAALFVILFIYGWNQYLWPLMVTTEPRFYTIVVGIQRLALAADEGTAVWHYVMATAILALVPPVAVVVGMRKLFVRGLVETEK
ncbi:MAG: sn-glycerol-3-phosphate ABC transporter permease UgpE [Hyphomicrobiales bacterium]|nr:sn-glycerol-3-phosphate ABC transporter permease UgpE [Hyphomicrobiales bacterium]MDE2017834.1 sn-glycerol-3-phosphate ABC transporter permease UgpE [Hyphomicrobiales bacterium]